MLVAVCPHVYFSCFVLPCMDATCILFSVRCHLAMCTLFVAMCVLRVLGDPFLNAEEKITLSYLHE